MMRFGAHSNRHVGTEGEDIENGDYRLGGQVCMYNKNDEGGNYRGGRGRHQRRSQQLEEEGKFGSGNRASLFSGVYERCK